jgi:hypothetical protein
MMKQPGENTNATFDEIRAAQDRARPEPRGLNHEEVAEVARQLWRERGGIGGSADEDWFRATEIVRERYVGNKSGELESYVASTNVSRTGNDLDWKERFDMDYNTTETTGQETQTGQGRGVMDRASSAMADMKTRASDTMGDLRNRASEMTESEPRSTPRWEHREGTIARSIEQQTARLPSDVWLWAAVGSMGLSLAFELTGKEKTANFIGHWVPTLLIFGLYNKMVKLQGSDSV